jgi:hypothetical protein
MCPRCYGELHPRQRTQPRAATMLTVLVNAAATLRTADNNIQAPVDDPPTENNKENRPMLTMDNVSFHHKPERAAALLAKKVVVNTFPPNTTCRLQPLDHSINGIIKRKICSAWTKWMRRPNPAYTVDGNLQQPQRQEIMDWVLTAVDGVQPEAIRRSFRHCWPTLMVLNE